MTPQEKKAMLSLIDNRKREIVSEWKSYERKRKEAADKLDDREEDLYARLLGDREEEEILLNMMRSKILNKEIS